MRRSAVATALAVAWIQTPAHAQVAQSEASPGAAASPEKSPPRPTDAAVGDIIVTATRRAQNLQDVPVAVTAVSEQQVKSLSLLDTRDLVRIAPALTFGQGSTTKLYNFVVRGIGSYITSDGFDQSVGIAADGVPLARPSSSIADLVDVERIEVLEGPQGMLFGRNASAGLVNIITRRPTLNDTSFTGRASYGSYDESQLSGSINIPLSSTLAVRATGWRYRHDGYVTALSQPRKLGVKDSGGARLRLLWKPDDRLTALVTGEVTSSDNDPSVTTIRAFANANFGVQAYEASQGVIAGPGNLTTTSNHLIANRNKGASITADVSYDLGGPVLTSVTSYRHTNNYDKYDPGSTSAPGYVSDQADGASFNQFSQELRLNSDTGRLRYVLGAIYFRLKTNGDFFAETAQTTPTPLGINVALDIESLHYGAFGELTFDLTKKLRIIGGGRISHDRVSADYNKSLRFTPAVIIPGQNTPGSSFGPLAVNPSVADTQPSYRFGLQYDLARDVMIYTTASRGYKAAGLDVSAGLTAGGYAVAQGRVKAEIAKNYEVGIRSQFFDRRLTLNATAFAETFTDFQIAVRLPTQLVIYAVQNAKEMKSTGVTVQLDARPFKGFSLATSAAYIHARYTDFLNAPCYPREPTAPVGSPLVSGVCVGGVQNMNGRPLSNSPKWRFNATARQEVPIGDYTVFAQANYRYQSSEVFNAVADPYEAQDGFSVVNLSAGVGPQDGRWRLSAYGNNIFDKAFVGRTIPQNSGSYYVQVVPYEARARYGVALDVSF